MTPCPSDDQLSALAAGSLSGTALEEIERHVDGCANCRQLVAVVSNGSAPTTRHEFGVLRAGERLGRYEIERLMGAGGMGVLYIARDPQLNRRVALKLMRPAFAAEGGSVRLRREAQSMATLAHPNVVNVFDIGEAGDRVFMAMELLEGGTLRDWMKEPHSWKELVAIFCDAGEGLAAAHAAGVVHRDFKPENVMIGKDGRPRVGDFGLARPELVAEEELPKALALAAPAMRVTHTGTLLGTPAYMSPEQLKGKPADARSDQYGFCVCLYEALVGHRPFPADTLEELRARVEGGMPPPPRDGLVPAHVWAAIARGLNPRPEERFPDMSALLQVLRFDAPAKAIEPAAARTPRRTIELRAGLAVFSIALLGAGVFVQQRSHVTDVGDVDPIGNTAVISLAVGARKAINAPNLSTVSIDHEHIVKVEKAGPSETLLILEGREPGTATLTITNTSGSTYEHHVRVEPENDVALLPQSVPLFVGHQKVVVVPKLVRIAVGDPAIADVKTIGDDQVLLVGASAGTTTLLAWTKDGTRGQTTVTVTDDPASKTTTRSETLFLGQMTVFTFPKLKRVAVGDPSVVDVKTIGDDTVLTIGSREGKTTLLVWTKDGTRQAIELQVEAAEEAGNLPEAEFTPLYVGQQKVFTVSGLARVAVGDPAVLDVKTIGQSEVLVNAVGAGKTTLIAWTKDGQRHITQFKVRDSGALPVQGVVLTEGAKATVSFPKVERVTREDPTIADVTNDATSVTVTGKKPGSSSIAVYAPGEAKPTVVRVTVTRAASPVEVPDVITLRPNDLAEFHVAGLTRVAIGDPSVADVKISGEEAIRINGLAKGTTTLLAWMKDGTRRTWSIQIK